VLRRDDRFTLSDPAAIIEFQRPISARKCVVIVRTRENNTADICCSRAALLITETQRELLTRRSRGTHYHQYRFSEFYLSLRLSCDVNRIRIRDCNANISYNIQRL